MYVKMKKYFFALISLMLAAAATLEFFLSYELKNQCSGHNILSAPVIAGSCLLGSFILNSAWLMARKRQAASAIRAALFVWTATVTIGVCAAGAALGQALLYDVVCVDGQGASTLETDVNVILLQYSAIALLVLSVAAPHALKKKSTDVSASAEGNPLLRETNNSEEKPLTFL